MSAKRTTPQLTASRVNGTSPTWSITTPDGGGLVADVYYERIADTIVKCVNAHDALVALVKTANHGTTGSHTIAWQQKAKAILAQVEAA